MKTLVSLLLLCSTVSAMYSRNVITYTPTGGRLGDNLLQYCHARWLSYKYAIPLLYKPFPYSSDLVLESKHTLTSTNVSEFTPVVLQHPQDTLALTKQDALYIVPPFYLEIEDAGIWSTFDINWHDPHFLTLLKSEIKPKHTLNLSLFPRGYTAIALHIRKGGGFDLPLLSKNRKAQYSDVATPLRFPPTSYYLEQVKNLVFSLNKKSKIYIHIFTDDSRPHILAQQVKQVLKNRSVMIGFRNVGNYHDKNVLEDLFSMAHYHYLIRPESAFSFIASKLGNFIKVIRPANYRWHKGRLVIDAVLIEDRAGISYKDVTK